MCRLIDHVSLPPEIHCYRVQPLPSGDHLKEPLPPPFTLAKAFWALSLFSSWRGIGWNFTAPLSALAKQPPFARTSSRRSFVWRQIKYLPVLISFGWATQAYMRTVGLDFFAGNTSYDALPLSHKFGHSLAVVSRVVWALNVGYIPVSIACVLWGGWRGWEGEFWSPWGWPPILGGLREVWEYPGLSTMWSRVSPLVYLRCTPDQG